MSPRPPRYVFAPGCLPVFIISCASCMNCDICSFSLFGVFFDDTIFSSNYYPKTNSLKQLIFMTNGQKKKHNTRLFNPTARFLISDRLYRGIHENGSGDVVSLFVKLCKLSICLSSQRDRQFCTQLRRHLPIPFREFPCRFLHGHQMYSTLNNDRRPYHVLYLIQLSNKPFKIPLKKKQRKL